MWKVKKINFSTEIFLRSFNTNSNYWKLMISDCLRRKKWNSRRNLFECWLYTIQGFAEQFTLLPHGTFWRPQKQGNRRYSTYDFLRYPPSATFALIYALYKWHWQKFCIFRFNFLKFKSKNLLYQRNYYTVLWSTCTPGVPFKLVWISAKHN